MFTSLSVQRRKYTCPICEREVTIDTKPIEKFILVCVHPDTQGKILPVMALREEGTLVRD